MQTIKTVITHEIKFSHTEVEHIVDALHEAEQQRRLVNSALADVYGMLARELAAIIRKGVEVAACASR